MARKQQKGEYNITDVRTWRAEGKSEPMIRRWLRADGKKPARISQLLKQTRINPPADHDEVSDAAPEPTSQHQRLHAT